MSSVISIFAPGESAEEKANAVARGRRNLLLITVALFFAETYGITVQSGQLFGVSVGFKEKIDLAVPFWVVAFYFLLRFSQSLQSFVELGVQKTFLQRFTGFSALRTAQRKARRTLDGATYFEGLPQYDRYTFTPTGAVEKHDTGLQVRLSVDGIGPGQRASSTGTVIVLSHRDLLLPRLRAWLYVLLATPIGTDLFLPPALLFLVLGIKLAGGFG